MHRIKATDLVALRKLFAERDAETTRRFMRKLSVDARALYESAVPVVWVPAPLYCEIQLAAAEVLYPDHLQALTKLGRELAQRSFSEVYKLLMALPTLAFVARRASVFWSLYHSEGSASIENQRANSMQLVVREAPEFPAPLADAVTGHLLALGDMTRTPNAKVIVTRRDPAAWTWLITWHPPDP